MKKKNSNTNEFNLNNIKTPQSINFQKNNFNIQNTINKSNSEHNLLNPHKNLKTKIKREYNIIKELGKGAYGTVYLVKREGKKYAMKVLEKAFLSRNNKSNDALIERIVLSMCNHKSIIKLISSFQTKSQLIFIIEYCPNKDLDFILRKFGKLNHELAIKFFAEIVNVIDYLHNTLKISHNDLKPSNIMLDKNYHLKLIDFSTCKIVNKKFDKTVKNFIDCDNYIDKEIIGTAEYVSPEMIEQKIFDYRTNDIWSLGVILYYFYHGKTPFIGNNDFDTFNNIKKIKYEINNLLNDDIKDLISHIFIDCNKRYTINDIKKHSYFKNINWDNLLNEEIPIPKELLNQMTMKLTKGDSNTDFWENFCNEINNNNNKDFSIVNINDNGFLNFIDDYFYSEENNQLFNNHIENIELKNGKVKLIYEGIVIQIVKKSENEVKFKLYNNKILQIWEYKKLSNNINLSHKTKISLGNDNLIKLDKFTFKTIQSEALKWYNIITSVMFLD